MIATAAMWYAMAHSMEAEVPGGPVVVTALVDVVAWLSLAAVLAGAV